MCRQWDHWHQVGCGCLRLPVRLKALPKLWPPACSEAVLKHCAAQPHYCMRAPIWLLKTPQGCLSVVLPGC